MSKRTDFGSIDAFRGAAKDAEAPIADARIRASLDTEVKAGEGDSRIVTFTISTAAIDRMGDTIAVDGWRLDAYRKNPVVLWAHDSGSLPVAKANKLWIEGDKLKAETEFTPKGLARFNDTVFEMYRQGFMSATSVGFTPLKYAFTEDPSRRYGIDFLEQELLEFSCVPVPANPEALIDARAVGIDTSPVREWIEKMLDGEGMAVLPRGQLEAILGLPGRLRADAKKAPKGGARGIYLRNANLIERALKADGGPVPAEETVDVEVAEVEAEVAAAAAEVDPAAVHFRDIAERRLVLLKQRRTA